MNTLPVGWISTNVDEISLYVQRGKSPKYTGVSALPVVNQKCIRWNGLEEQHLKFIDPSQWDAWGPERFLRQGDILWNSTGTGTIGRAAIFEGSAKYKRIVADSHVTVVRCSGEIEPKYLHALIRSPVVQNKIDDMQNGSTNQVELGREQVLSTLVPLAPIAEQRRIVAKIDSLSGKSKRARDHLDHLPPLIQKYLEAVLEVAFQQASSTAKKQLRSLVVAGPQNGLYLPKERYGRGVPILRIQNYDLRETESVEKWRQVQIDNATREQYRIRSGDLIINRVNSPSHLGKSLIVTNIEEGAVFESNMMRLSLIADVEPRYLKYFLNSSTGRGELTRNAKWAVNQASINQTDVLETSVPCPSLTHQQQVVRFIENNFAWIDRLAAEATSARKLIDRLDQAVLSKAFRGELVPQDPNDEPASVLLERIKIERAGTSSPSRRRGRPKAVPA